jgi:large repetitive protein
MAKFFTFLLLVVGLNINTAATFYSIIGYTQVGNTYNIHVSSDPVTGEMGVQAQLKYSLGAGDLFTGWTIQGNPTPNGTTQTFIISITLPATPIAPPLLEVSNINSSGGGYSYSGFIALPALLPITLKKFTATPRANENVLSWTTATEKDNEFFAVERSTDGVSFTQLGRVQGAGTTTMEHNYTFTDKTPVTGMNYYRLKDVAFDGTSSYSKVVAATIGKRNSLVVYPNPATDLLNVEYTSEKDATSINIQVIDMYGKIQTTEVVNLIEGSNVLLVPVQQLAAGAYLVKVGETVLRFEKK